MYNKDKKNYENWIKSENYKTSFCVWKNWQSRANEIPGMIILDTLDPEDADWDDKRKNDEQLRKIDQIK